ncbi:MAG: hypothetical protein M3512_11220 [Bacteroidota bacterium]|nr:hypothetical protein [Bacteroidota bacterium]
MRGKISILFILFFIQSQLAFSQNYERLIHERQELLEQLQEAESQTTSLLGKKSKKDLRNTTEILKDIVEKDSQIISALRKEYRKETSPKQTSPDPENDQKIIELESQLASLNNLSNQRNIKTAELEQQVVTVNNRMFKYQSTILVTFLIILMLAFYISKLRKKVKVRENA